MPHPPGLERRAARASSRRALLLTLAAAVGLIASCGDEPPGDEGIPARAASEQEAWFEEVAAESGLDFLHTSGHRTRYWFPEIMIGGVCLLDYDGDGRLDVYLVQGGSLDPDAGQQPENRLFRNRGGGGFIDVTASAGAGDSGYGMGCTAGDYDGDGDGDLYVTNVGPNALLRNNGDGTFSDVTVHSGAGHPGWGSSTVFVDYDGDRDLDLFVVNYVRWSRGQELDCFASGGLPDYCSPSAYQSPAPDVLYRNNGDGTFSDVTGEAGIARTFGTGLGVAAGDFNGDGRMDLYVANDGMANQLWINQGDGSFVDEALLAGAAVNMQGTAEAGMGVVAEDVDDDGDPDLFVSHLRQESNTLYVNLGGVFEDSTAQMGLAGASLASTGFGLGFADFDHDGSRDLYIAGGRVRLHQPRMSPDDPFAEPNLLFRGRAGAAFEEVMPRGGTRSELIHTSRGTGLGDLDHDGDLDLVVVNKDAPPYLLRNLVGSRGNWVSFRIADRAGGDAVGAAVRVTANGRSQWRYVRPGYGYCSSNDPAVHFGLDGAANLESVEVSWPDGDRLRLGPVAAGRRYEIRRR